MQTWSVEGRVLRKLLSPADLKGPRLLFKRERPAPAPRMVFLVGWERGSGEVGPRPAPHGLLKAAKWRTKQKAFEQEQEQEERG